MAFEFGRLIPAEFTDMLMGQLRFNATINEFVLNEILCGLDTDDPALMLILLKKLQTITSPPPPRGRMCGSDGVY